MDPPTLTSSSSSNSQSFMISSELSTKISMTHSLSTHEVDLTPLVKVIEGIFQNAVSKGAYVASSDRISNLKSHEGMRQALDDIRSISCEMSCNLTDVDEITFTVLRKLSYYSWNAKMVLAIAAFAVNVGELLILIKHRNTDPLAMSVDLIKDQAVRIDESLLNNLLKDLQEVVQTNMAFLAPPISAISKNSASMKDAMEYFPTATYKTLGNIVQIARILCKREDNMESISSLINEVHIVNTFLQEKLTFCKEEIAYAEQGMQVTDANTTEQGTQIEAIGELIPTSNYSELIQKIKDSFKIQVPAKLRKKHVLFLVSDLGISVGDIRALNRLYKNSNRRYEIVWIPMVDVTSDNITKSLELQTSMTWSRIDPSKMGTVMMEHIRKEWNFVKNPIAVALNPEGRVVCPNALPMLWTWGNDAFPFDGWRERELWSTYNERNGWRLELLIDDQIDHDIPLWIQSRAFVCLFGGDNKSWIQDFTEIVKMAISGTGIPLKLVYVGTNKGKGLLRNQLGLDIHVIKSESQWHFWSRLESIMYAKIQQGKISKYDLAMQEASRILGFAAKGEAWAMFSVGTAAMVTASREMAINIMAKYRDWKKETTYTGIEFLEAIRTYYSKIIKVDGNNQSHVGVPIDFHLPALLGEVPGIVNCPECFMEMKVFFTYHCSSK